MKSDYTTNSRYITHTIAFSKVGRIHFLSSGVKGLSQAFPSGKWPPKSTCPMGTFTSPRLPDMTLIEPCKRVSCDPNHCENEASTEFAQRHLVHCFTQFYQAGHHPKSWCVIWLPIFCLPAWAAFFVFMFVVVYTNFISDICNESLWLQFLINALGVTIVLSCPLLSVIFRCRIFESM